MPPSFARADLGNLRLRDTVFAGKPSLRHTVNGADSPHLPLSQFRAAAPLPPIVCSVTQLVGGVPRSGIPPEILDSVVVADTIGMAALVSFRARTGEGRKNEH